MATSYPISIIQSFEKPDVLRFRRFLRSPLHNRHQEVATLFELILKMKPPPIDPDYKQRLFAQLYSDRPFSDLKMRHLFSELHKRLERFLIWTELEREPFLPGQLLIQAYERRNLKKPLIQGLKKQAHTLERSNLRDQGYYHHHFQLELSRYNIIQGRDTDIRTSLQQLSNHLDSYFVSQKLKHACNILNHKKVFHAEYDMGLLEEILHYVETEKMYTQPVVGLYYYAYKTLSSEEESNWFFTLKAELEEHFGKLERYEVRGIYLYGINYCIRLLNKGKTSYLREVFELYRSSLNNGILFDKGQLTPWTYKNVVAAGIKLTEYDWVEMFIRTYQKDLSSEFRESLFAYNLARLHAEKGEFRKVVRLLSALQIKDTFTQLDIKVLLAKAYFELGEISLIEYLLDSFAQLLRRKELLTYHRVNYKNFVRFFRALANVQPYDFEGKEALREKIEATDEVIERSWFLTALAPSS